MEVKRARPDIQNTISVLCGRVKNPNLSDWNKLLRLLQYLHGTVHYKQVINTKNDLNITKWCDDTSFAVHPDFKSHKGAVMVFEESEGATPVIFSKQN